MDRVSDHLETARRFQATLDYLCTEKHNHQEWICAVAFYVALHFVDALLESRSEEYQHSHDGRLWALKSNRSYQHIHKHFRPLYDASLLARYRSNGDRTFETELEGKCAVDIFVKHRLHQVRSGVQSLMSQT